MRSLAIDYKEGKDKEISNLNSELDNLKKWLKRAKKFMKKCLKKLQIFEEIIKNTETSSKVQ